jgi:hypothetical protein
MASCGVIFCRAAAMAATKVSGFGSAPQCLYLAPHLFDGIEVWGVGRKETDLRPGQGDQGEGLCILVRGKIIHDDPIARAQRRAQNLADLSLEHLGVGGAIDGHAGRRTIQPDGTDHGGGVPMAVRGVRVHPLPTGSASAQPRHVGFGSRLIQQDQFFGVQPRLPPPPGPPRPRDVGTILFAGAECLFLYVSPIFART